MGPLFFWLAKGPRPSGQRSNQLVEFVVANKTLLLYSI